MSGCADHPTVPVPSASDVIAVQDLRARFMEYSGVAREAFDLADAELNAQAASSHLFGDQTLLKVVDSVLSSHPDLRAP